MAYIIITGHKNPDMNSVCSAWCYADFKNKTDPENNYIPVRCGKINNQTKAAFEKAGIKPPVFMKDVSPKVADVTRRDIVSLEINDPIFKAIKVLDEENISCIPIFEEGNEFRGIITMHQINITTGHTAAEKQLMYRKLEDNLFQLPGILSRKKQLLPELLRVVEDAGLSE